MYVYINKLKVYLKISCSSDPSLQSVLPSHLRFMSTQCPSAQVNSSSEQNEKVMDFVVCRLSGQRLESLNIVHEVVPKIL